MVGLYHSNVFDKSIILKQGSKARQGLENRGSNNSNQRWGKLRKDVAHALHPRSLKKPLQVNVAPGHLSLKFLRISS